MSRICWKTRGVSGTDRRTTTGAVTNLKEEDRLRVVLNAKDLMYWEMTVWVYKNEEDL
jgi:hypothetical protein